MNHEIKVSIITIFYNAEKYLKECIKSTLSQSHKNIELILINDASTDKSEKIVSQFKDQRIVYYKNKNNIGVTDSYNLALTLSNGKYISILDSDDFADKYKIEKLLEIIIKENACLSFSRVKFIGKGNYMLKNFLDYNSLLVILIYGNPIVHSSILVKSDVIKKIKYDKSFLTAPDYKLYVEMILMNCKFVMTNKILTYYRIHKNQDSKKKKKLMNKESFDIAYQHISNLNLINYTFNLRMVIKHTSKISKIQFFKSLLELKVLNLRFNSNFSNLEPFIIGNMNRVNNIDLKFLLSIIRFNIKFKIKLSKLYLIMKYIKIKITNYYFKSLFYK